METLSAQIYFNQAITKWHDGREYLVLPAVAMVAGVHNGLLYPADELAKFPAAWNGRPVSISHPKDFDGNPISCNHPNVVENQVVGQLWNTRWNDDRLQTEVWIDTMKAQRLNSGILAKLQSGLPMEVSTGLFVDEFGDSGEFKDKRYRGIARNYRPDHLALLPDEIGACSWTDGCGVPRVNQEYPVSQFGIFPMPALLLANEIQPHHQNQDQPVASMPPVLFA